MSTPEASANTGIRSWWALALILVTAIVVPLGAFAFVVADRATAAVRAEARTSLAGTASRTALFLGAQLRAVSDLVESYARRPALLQALSGPQGVDGGELNRQMSELQNARSDVLNVAGIADAAGTMLAAPQAPPIVGMDFSGRDWYRGTVASGRTYVSEAFGGASPGSPLAISVASPVLDNGQRMVAIIVTGYTIKDVQLFVQRFAAVQGTDVIVTDQRGVLIAGPGPSPTSITSLAGDERVRKALEGEVGGTDTIRDSGGRRVLSAYAPVPDLGWAVVAQVPRSRAYAQVNRLQTTVVLIALPLGLLSIVGGVLLARALRSRDTARERAERLASINAAVLEASREGLSLADQQGRPLLRNTTMMDLSLAVGIDPAANLYAELARVAPAMSDPEAFAAAAKAFRSDPSLELVDEFTIAASDRSFHRYSRPVRNEAGVVVGRLTVLREQTAERRAQAAIRAAQEEAERANRAKSEFLSRMSHELRTPLNAILGFAQLLDMDELADEPAERVNQIERAGHHLLALINEVLDMSRIEAGQIELSVEPVHLGSLVAETVSLVARAAETCGVSIVLAVPDDHWASADRQRLKQVLLNLLSNAINYNRQGGMVTVTSTLVDGTLQIRVRDTGHGIPEDRRVDLFVPFNRLGADSSGVEGSGLGLSLSLALTEVLGGRLCLEASSTGGSTFLLVMPATEPTPAGGTATSAEREQLHVEADHRPRPTGNHTILSIEDNLANVDLLSYTLGARSNLTLIPSMQGSVGLELARSVGPSLILLDLHLPDVSGEEVLRRLKADPSTAPIPVVILTADVIDASPERLLGRGARDFLTKPIDVRRLLEVVDLILIEQEAT